MSRVTFKTSDDLVQKLFDTAEEKLKLNLKNLPISHGFIWVQKVV